MIKQRYRRLWICLFLLLAVQIMGYTMVMVSPVQGSQSIEDRPFPTDQLNQDTQDTPDTSAPSTGLTIVKLILALLLIIFLAYLIIRAFGKQVNQRFRGRWLQVVDEMAVGPNRGVVLCEIGGRIWALGVTDQRINVLFEIEDEDLIKEILSADTVSERNGEWNQATRLKNLIDRFKGTYAEPFEKTMNNLMGPGEQTGERGNHR